jgi:hypothetical protein
MLFIAPAGYCFLNEAYCLLCVQLTDFLNEDCCILYVQVTDFYMRYMYVVYCMCRLLTFTWGTCMLFIVCAGYWLLHEVHVCCLLYAQVTDFYMRYMLFIACADYWLYNEACCFCMCRLLTFKWGMLFIVS